MMMLNNAAAAMLQAGDGYGSSDDECDDYDSSPPRESMYQNSDGGLSYMNARSDYEQRQIFRRGRRGKYSCSKCGQPKQGHVCLLTTMLNHETQTDLGVTTGRCLPAGRIMLVSQRKSIQVRKSRKKSRGRMPPLMHQQSLTGMPMVPGLMKVADAPATKMENGESARSSPAQGALLNQDHQTVLACLEKAFLEKGFLSRNGAHSTTPHFNQDVLRHHQQMQVQIQIRQQLQQQQLLQLQLQLHQQHQQQQHHFQHQQYQHTQAPNPDPSLKRKSSQEEEACLALHTLRDITPSVESRNIKHAKLKVDDSKIVPLPVTLAAQSSIVANGMNAIDV
jgi:hypothetical protein